MKSWLKAALLSALLVPPTLLGHEGGHYLGYLAADVPGASISYNYSGFEGLRDFWIALQDGDRAAASAIADIELVGWSAVLGLVISTLFGAVGIWMMAARKSLLGAALFFGGLWRLPVIALMFVAIDPKHTDEAHVEQALGIPGWGLLGAELLLMVAGLWVMFRRLGTKVSLAVLGGGVAGGIAWNAILGPLLLP